MLIPVEKDYARTQTQNLKKLVKFSIDELVSVVFPFAQFSVKYPKMKFWKSLPITQGLIYYFSLEVWFCNKD